MNKAFMEALPRRRSSRLFDPVGPNEKVCRNLPRLADPVDHIDRQRPPARENFGCARTRAQEFRKLNLAVAEFVDRIVKDLDGIEAFVGIDRPASRFIALDKRHKDIELVSRLGALGCAPAGLDLGKCRVVIPVVANWPDVHGRPVVLVMPSL